jgi:hypothetical protein
VNILRELRHPYIVRYYDRIIDKAATRIYIVMEFAEGGDLGAMIKKARATGCVRGRAGGLAGSLNEGLPLLERPLVLVAEGGTGWVVRAAPAAVFTRLMARRQLQGPAH